MRAWPLLLLLLLLIGSATAQAAGKGVRHGPHWSRVGRAEGATLYLDRRSIVRQESGRRAWTLRSFRRQQTTPGGKPYRSLKAQHVYACGARSATLLAQIYYPEAMGKGEPVENYRFEQFSPEAIAPGTPYAAALAAVCRRR
jgi:hypothetical protein